MIALSDNARGAAMMTASMAAFTLNDAFTKAVSDELPLFQILLWRGIAVSVLLTAFTLWRGTLHFRLPPREWFWIAVRTATECATAWFFLQALFNMPIANATAILQTLPLAVTLAGALFLGESVGWRRWSAIAAGFVGVLLIVRPGPEGFDIYALYALAAVFCVTLRDLATWQIDKDVPTQTVAVAAAVGVTLYAAVFTVGTPLAPVSSVAAMQIAGATACIMAAYIFSVAAMRFGEISFSAPFRYTGIVWALVLGLAVFEEFPDAITLAGAALIVASGLYTIRRGHAPRPAKGLRPVR